MTSAGDPDADTRARIQQHWEASERGDIDAEHVIYAADAVLAYPQSGERFRGRSRIQAQRGRARARSRRTRHSTRRPSALALTRAAARI
jgi:ketosteroid isomerase-like protein